MSLRRLVFFRPSLNDKISYVSTFWAAMIGINHVRSLYHGVAPSPVPEVMGKMWFHPSYGAR